MRFGQTLKTSVYEPWRANYMDYTKLKGLLREGEGKGEGGKDKAPAPWTADDENKFCDEILNVQLERVASFQTATFRALEDRATAAADKLRDLAPEQTEQTENPRSQGEDEQQEADGDEQKESGEEVRPSLPRAPISEITKSRFREIEDELDSIINETKELKKFSNVNYTGFLKIVKKHDRKRGSNYKIRPMVQMALNKRPFNSEHVYSPLLNRLSLMYFVVCEQLDEGSAQPVAPLDARSQIQNGERYTAYKFWVHPDNLLEVKTYVLRRLPVLVYSEQSSKGSEAQSDPTLNSLYFDNPNFSLYDEKVGGGPDASSLRIRWFGQLNSNPELVVERKVIHYNGSSEEQRFSIKEKYILPFIKGEYHMEKTVQKMEKQGQPTAKVAEFKARVDSIQTFIREKDLQPVLRANYTRTAFQKPADDRVRVSIDSSLAFIREDALDVDRPCRNPESWHRSDIDMNEMVYPFATINSGEISRFPFSILEIKVKEDSSKKTPQWIYEIMASHLVHSSPSFSKFVHGVSSLFEDHVNNLPFWLSEVETDIRKHPQEAFEREEERKAQRVANEQVVGSFQGTPLKGSSSYRPAISSPLAKSYMQERLKAEERASASKLNGKGKATEASGASRPEDESEGEDQPRRGYGTLSGFPSFSFSRYAQFRRSKKAVSEAALPPGVTKPLQLIKDSGPLHVEPKVWLANERTFLKWQHISVLLGGLAVGLYTAAGEGGGVAAGMGIAYVAIAAFAGAWGAWMHRVRRDMIVQRSGKDFDNLVGPIVVSVALCVALVLNFSFKYAEARHRFTEGENERGGDAPVNSSFAAGSSAPLAPLDRPEWSDLGTGGLWS